MSEGDRTVRTRASCLAIIVLLLTVSSATIPVDGRGDGEGASRVEGSTFVNDTEGSGLGPGSRSRVAWGDYNDDGHVDVLFRGRELWRNNGDGTFFDVTSSSGLQVSGARGGIWGDYDNDGDPDVFQLHGTDGDDRLFRNNGDGTFTDVTHQAGEISDGGLPTEGAAWGDYDNDGNIDLYLANYEDPPNSANGTHDVLFHNNGDGTFTNVTEEAGMLVEPLCGRGVAWADYNDDGFQDIYVTNYRLDRNLLWRNNGDGTFTDVAEELGVEGDLVMGYYGHSIGSTWGDIDNDGDLDLFVANLAHPRFLVFSDISKLYINSGPPDHSFEDVPIQVRGIAYEETHSDPSLADYDNDGDLDLFITSVYDGRPTFLYENDGQGSFTDVTEEAGTVTDNGWGAAWADYTGDGFLDLAVGSGNSTKFRLFRNAGNVNDWMNIRLKGRTSNSQGLGARVQIEAGNLSMIRELAGGRGTTSQDQTMAHFGLEDAGRAGVLVHWPSGVVQRKENLSTGKTWILTEPDPVTDFELCSVDYSDDRVNSGENVTLDLRVRNQGTISGDADIELSIDGIGVVEEYPIVRDLGPGAQEEYTIEWSTTGLEGALTVHLEIVDPVPEDVDETDNRWQHTFHINTPPVATISSISPPVAYQGRDIVNFKGEAEDDGYVAAVTWTSDLDGLLSEELTFSMEADALSAGTHAITLRVEDDMGLGSEPVQRTLVIEPPVESERPVARILEIEPNPAREDETVRFEGEGSDPDGRVVSYRWGSSLEGPLGDGAIFTTTDLAVGTHIISLVVTDDDGMESEAAEMELEVVEANTPPVAHIELIYPNPAHEDERVRFQGRGTDREGEVDTFIWTSDLDGIFSRDYDFSTSELSTGVHRIGLKVKDDEGAWSQEVYETLEILTVNEPPTVEIDGIVERSEDRMRIKGTSQDPDGEVVVVEIRVDNGGWQTASSSGRWIDWYFDMDTGDLEPGVHRVYARSFDGQDHSDLVMEEFTVKEEERDLGTVLEDLWDSLMDGEPICFMVMLITLLVVGMIYIYALPPGRGGRRRRRPPDTRPTKEVRGSGKGGATTDRKVARKGKG